MSVKTKSSSKKQKSDSLLISEIFDESEFAAGGP